MIFAFVATALLLGPSHAETCAGGNRSAAIVRVAEGLQADLKAKLMGKFDAMNAKREGIFHEDVTPTVAPYFPAGQPIADTRKIIAEQHLGEFVPFKGKMMADENAPFPTKFHLMGAQYSQVEVIFDFDFDGTNETNFKVKSVHAYLRGTSM